MNKKEILKKVEDYVKKAMKQLNNEAHGFFHVDRVRKWALKIAKEEGGVNLFLLEVAALLHDIGRVKESKTVDHYEAGEKIARKFLQELNYFSPSEIDLICRGVYLHGEGGKEKLVQILKDADIMDLLGAVAVARAFSFHHDKPHYDREENSFEFKQWSQEEIKRVVKQRPWDKSVVDNLIFNLSVYQYINTKTAKRMAREKFEYLKNFVKQLKKETIDI